MVRIERLMLKTLHVQQHILLLSGMSGRTTVTHTRKHADAACGSACAHSAVALCRLHCLLSVVKWPGCTTALAPRRNYVLCIASSLPQLSSLR